MRIVPGCGQRNRASGGSGIRRVFKHSRRLDNVHPILPDGSLRYGVSSPDGLWISAALPDGNGGMRDFPGQGGINGKGSAEALE